MKNTVRAMAPILALVLVAACSDSTGPGAPELAEVQEEAVEQDGSNEVRGTEVKRKMPLEQEREDGT